MTALSRVKVTFEDYNLGLVPPISEAHAKIGVAAAGPLTPQWMTRGSQALDAYQGGPLAGACAVALLETAPVVGVRVNATTQGTVSEVTKVGTGASVMTTGGTVNDAYSLTLRVTRSGTATDGLAAVVVSTNGNDGPERSVPASGTLDLTGTGLSVTFGAGGLTEGDTYSLTTTAPAATVADIITALETLLGSRPDLRFVHILGAATPALVAGVDAVLTERETRNYYVHALLEAPAMTDGERMSDYLSRVSALFANLTSLRVAVALDGGAVYNPITRQLERRSSAWKLSARRATVPIGEAPYRVRTGPLPAMGALAFDANLTGNVGRFAALRTYDGREGGVPGVLADARAERQRLRRGAAARGDRPRGHHRLCLRDGLPGRRRAGGHHDRAHSGNEGAGDGDLPRRPRPGGTGRGKPPACACAWTARATSSAPARSPSS